MANVKISSLPAVTTIANGDVLPLVSGGVTTKVPVNKTGSNYIPYVDANGDITIGGGVVSTLQGSDLDLGFKIDNAAWVQKNLIGHNYEAGLDGFAIRVPSLAISTSASIKGFNDGSFQFVNDVGTTVLGVSQSGRILVGVSMTDASTGIIQAAGNISPSIHNTHDLGTTAVRWKDLWLQSGAFNGSDARLKTEIRPFTPKEIEASKQLSKEIGTYQWLESVKEKGADRARRHVGMTVQRAIEIMAANGLNPFDYGFIGYDKWDDTIVHHDEIKAQAATLEELDEAGNLVKEATPEVEFVAAWDEVVLKAGDAFSFRYDQLNQFIARGFEARLTALEALL